MDIRKSERERSESDERLSDDRTKDEMTRSHSWGPEPELMGPRSAVIW